MDDEADSIAAVRRFNRFYTRRLGLLDESLLGGPLTLPECRLIYEIAQEDGQTAKALGAQLCLDSGYLSRLLRKLEDGGLILRRPSPDDGRQALLSLTPEGRAAFAAMDVRSRLQVRSFLEGLSPSERRRLTAALTEAETLLGGGRPKSAAPLVLRPPRAGDWGWIVHRHGVLYAREQRWGEDFEALVAEIVAEVLKSFDPARDRCWIAEREGDILGSIALCHAPDGVAKLRLLYVEPEARGLGLGRRLVEEAIRFAREAGYQTLSLWTNDGLAPAQSLYRATGFRIVHQEAHSRFGEGLIGQTWELAL